MAKIKENGRVYLSTRRSDCVIYGFHPEDISRTIYAFWESEFLWKSGAHEGQIVNVHTKYGRRRLYVTKIEEFNPQKIIPKKLATIFYTGDKYNDLIAKMAR